MAGGDDTTDNLPHTPTPTDNHCWLVLCKSSNGSGNTDRWPVILAGHSSAVWVRSCKLKRSWYGSCVFIKTIKVWYGWRWAFFVQGSSHKWRDVRCLGIILYGEHFKYFTVCWGDLKYIYFFKGNDKLINSKSC